MEPRCDRIVKCGAKRISSAMSDASRSIDLSGAWRFRADPDDVGRKHTWRKLDTRAWREINVPSAWQNHLGSDFHGIGWYARTVQVPDEWLSGRIRLRFEAIATGADVWANGRHIGSFIGDYVPFEFDLTDAIDDDGELDLRVRVDEMPDHITKGFHDVLSMHHGGIWQPVTLRATGALVPVPNGISAHADVNACEVRVRIELEEGHDGGDAGILLIVADESGDCVGSSRIDINAGTRIIDHAIDTAQLRSWSPHEPTLYTARVVLRDHEGNKDDHCIRFGARTIEADDRHILLNGAPIHPRGVLHWGHEPRHIAPAPTPEEVRSRFTQLRARGFNCVCLCMWYPPEYFFEIADETGMLLWQEHPVWQSSMDEAHLPEYRMLYEHFMRRDARHPSVIIVSATCEHPRFDPSLASWWWSTARERLSGTLLQVQTASFAWSDPNQTDLHDEHTYDNNNRWVTYLHDLQAHLDRMPPKPFVMGETIAFTSWPDTRAISEHVGNERPWWLTTRFDDCLRLEAAWRDRYGESVVERFRRQGDRHHLLGRKFQIEQFRRYPNHAGIVMNHLRDVPACTCGFMDDLDRWRFEPDDMRGWLDDIIAILETSDNRRSFASGEDIELSIAVSHAACGRLDESLSVSMHVTGKRGISHELPIVAEPGNIARVSLLHAFPDVDSVTRATLAVTSASFSRNTWTLWILPDTAREQSARARCCRLAGMPFTEEDAAPDDVERCYSRGFGIAVQTWINRLPDPAHLCPDLRAWRDDEALPENTRVIVTHRLTPPIIDHLEHGARVILFASKAPGGLGTEYQWLFGQTPLVIEEGPIHTGDSEWIVDLLGFDLTRTYARVIPIESLGWQDRVDPIIRLCYTHDQQHVVLYDHLFWTNVGDGVLMVSSLDHRDPAGQFILNRMIATLAKDDLDDLPATALDVAEIRAHAVEVTAEQAAGRADVDHDR